MAIPTKAAPVKSVKTFPVERIPSPNPKRIKEENKTISIPNFREILGIIQERKAKDIKGMVVINPAAVLDKDKSALISAITGPTEVSGARKFAAKKITPK